MMKKLLSLLLILALLVQLLPTVLPAFAATTLELTDHSFNGEGLWITEIYHTDVDRSEKNNTRPDSGYVAVDLFASASEVEAFYKIKQVTLVFCIIFLLFY